MKHVWNLMGYDVFSREWYPESGPYQNEYEALRAAKKAYDDERKLNPTITSGGLDGIQNRIYIEKPDGSMYLYGASDPENHYETLQNKITAKDWNEWRNENPEFRPNLCWTDLSGANLENYDLSNALMIEADLRNAHLNNTNLGGVILTGANLSNASFRRANLISAELSDALAFGADFTGADLKSANLERSSIVKTILHTANLSEAKVYGISAWDINAQNSIQRNLIITPSTMPPVRVDDIEVAQFIYLLLSREKIRKVINAMTNKGVLILGRFGGGGLEILKTIADRLRTEGYLPIIFDFEKPRDRNFTETVQILTGLARFVIVDLSGPSVPQELMATVPNYELPFIPILEAGKKAHSMFTDLLRFPWVAREIVYFSSREDLANLVHSEIINAAEKIIKEKAIKV